MKRKSTQVKLRLHRSNSGSTVFARGVVYLGGIAALAICFILLPELAREESVGKPTNVTVPFLAVSYILATPFFVALYQTLKLLQYIDGNDAFSEKSITALRNIKMCAIVFSIFIIALAATVVITARIINPTEDVTGFVTLGFIFTFVSSVIAVFVAVLQKLLTDAISVKSENDLIV